MIVNTDIPKLLTAGLKKEFMHAYEKATTDYKAIASIVKSSKNKETYAWLGAVPSMSEWKDEINESGGLNEHNFNITNYKWASRIDVDRDTLEDENLFSLNSVNSGNPLPGSAEGNPERSFLREERATTTGHLLI